jgi:small subunit ribosomal protein S8
MHPISDMLTQIKNAASGKKPEIVLSYSKFKHSLAGVLLKEGWLNAVEEIQNGNFKALKLGIKYQDTGEPAISGLITVSKPGQRIYAKSAKIPRVSWGLGETIVSTPKGLMTDKQARKQKLGGEVICQIW